MANDSTSKGPTFALRTQWQLFWHGIIGDDENSENKNSFQTNYLNNLTIDQIKQITRALSQDRKKLNQKIEQINKTIEEVSGRIEGLNLVGSDTDATLKEITFLTDEGQNLSLELQKVTEYLRTLREREDELRNQLRTEER
jgi:methyl-accepting chemotaxis protein